MVGPMKRILVFVVLVLAACIPSNSDPVEVGSFCFGADGCEGSVTLNREAVGRSRIDFAVKNVGDSEATVAMYALVPQNDETVIDISDAGDSDAGVTDPGLEDRTVAVREVIVAAGATETDRFAATELGTRRTIELAAVCTGCSVEVDFVYETEPLECRDETDCSSGWLCDNSLGRCAECLDDTDCGEEQQCSESGRCDPPIVEAGCGQAAGPTSLLALILVLGFFGIRRRKWFATLAFFAVFAISGSAFAAAPGAGFSLGAGPRWITGELGPVVERGIGISLGQELRWDYVGMGVQLNWAAFLTTQEPPPLSRNIQIFDFTAGPRGYLPVGDFQLVAGADYKRIGLAANSLVRLTGPDNGYHAVGGVLGGRWNGLGVELRADLGVHHIPDLASQLVMFELSVALTAGR